MIILLEVIAFLLLVIALALVGFPEVAQYLLLGAGVLVAIFVGAYLLGFWWGGLKRD